MAFYLELEKAAVWGLCPFSVQGLGFVTTDVFLEGEHPRLEEIMDCLDKRLVRVAEAYLSEYALDLVRLGVWGRHHFSADFLDQPPEVIGNGLVPPGALQQRMERMKKRKQRDMKPAGLFAWVMKVAPAKSGLLEEWVRLGYPLPDPRRDEDFNLHLRLIEAAFFGDRRQGFGLEPANCTAEFGARDSGFGIRERYETRTPKSECRFSRFQSRPSSFQVQGWVP
jgi:hypothetical protein